jgi:ribosomal protein RSM22 (predicted rRNA methylase)
MFDIDFPKRCFAVDRSPLMLEQAEKSHKYFFKSSNITYTNNALEIDSSSATLFFGNSANEINLLELTKIIEQIEPARIIFMEPGTKEFFSKMIKIRKYLVENDFYVNYPCATSGPCPLEAEGVKDWCHQYFKVSYEPSVERISQKLKKDRRNLPVTSFVFSRKKTKHEGKTIFRSYKESKFGKCFDICDETNSLRKIEAYYRYLNKKEQKRVNSLLAGEIVNYDTDKVLENGTIRVKNII